MNLNEYLDSKFNFVDNDSVLGNENNFNFIEIVHKKYENKHAILVIRLSALNLIKKDLEQTNYISFWEHKLESLWDGLTDALQMSNLKTYEDCYVKLLYKYDEQNFSITSIEPIKSLLDVLNKYSNQYECTYYTKIDFKDWVKKVKNK